MKYKVGDKVRIRKDLNEEDRYGIPCNSKMMELKGRLATIVDFYEDEYAKGYKIDLDNQFYIWSEKMFEGLAEYTYEDLKKAPIGTKITFEDGEIYVKNDKTIFHGCYKSFLENKHLEGLKDNYLEHGKIIKIEESTAYKTVYEVKDILDNKEKEYLSNVIKPFRDIVISIKKCESDYSCEFISIKFKKVEDVSNVDFVCLPDFREKTMYKGMELDKEYSLKELEL